MKKTLTLSLAALALAATTSCNEELNLVAGTSAEAASQQYLEQMLPAYTNAFEQQFGKMDPTHDWGMDEHVGIIEAFSAGTRAGEVNTNRNQWTEFDSKKKITLPSYPGSGSDAIQMYVPDFRSSALGYNIQIPGFPHLNGLYYTANGNVSANTVTGENITSGMIPAGDVTPYEIQYVSNWFRTHKNPTSNVNLHLSDFFIQNISWDNDQVNYNVEGITPYKSGWEKTGNNGKNIETVAEAKAHKNKDGGDYVKDGVLNENISYFLDQLGFKDMEDNWFHVNNFNSGNSNFDPENKESNPNRMIMYVKSSGTEGFRCHPSWCTDTEWIESWVLVRLTWVETVKDPNSPYPVGTAIPREGYYLGFDFHGVKSGQEVYQDGYYSNWIIKITPGFFTPTGNSKRIFCEDLGGSFDFDFNDAVVDVSFEQKGSKYEPIISVQAAGGTMPIYVQKEDAKYELHRMLGKSDKQTELKPINVGSTGGSHTVAIYRGELVDEDKASQINIFVKNTRTDPALHYKISGDESGKDSNGNVSSMDHQGQSTLNGNTVKDKTVAPSAFSAPTSVAWLQELQGITLAYENFPNWVADHTWNDNGKAWYDIVKPGAPLFDASTIQHGTGDFAPPSSDGGYDAGIEWRVLTPDPASADEVATVKADSYMRVEGYTGDEEAIFSRLDGMGDEDRITCTLVLNSSDKFDQTTNILQGILVPADINNGTLSYKGTEFTIGSMKNFKNASFVDNADIKESDRPTSGYTYTIEFSFKKSDIANGTKTVNGSEVTKYHNYLLFYLKVPNVNVGDSQSKVKVTRWYVHY